MIRLIVTDMDGCFLNKNKELHPDTFALIQKCEEKNIHFAIASGRSFPGLKKLFDSVLDKITLICDNGGYIFHHGKELYKASIDKDEVIHFVEEGLKFPNVLTTLSTPEHSYLPKKELSEEDKIEVGHHYPNIEILDDFKSVTEDVIKISFYDPKGTEQSIYPVLKKQSHKSSVLLSSDIWVDIIHSDANKGAGVNILRDFLGISKDETAVFGDYLNDIEMIQGTPLSFAPQDAHPEIKALASEVIGNNDDWSVFHKIQELIKENADE